jgi:hypothetical protein
VLCSGEAPQCLIVDGGQDARGAQAGSEVVSIREKNGAWRRTAARLALAGAIAIGLSASAIPTEAQASHRWIGPAIAGVVIGAAIAHHAHKRHYHSSHAHYGYPKYKYRKYAHRHRPRVVTYGYAPMYYYPAPVVVPMFGIGIYPGW